MKFFRLLFIPFAGLVVIAVRLLSPWRVIRFGSIVSTRLGHMAGNMECYLCEKDAGLSKGIDFWHHQGKPCNKQLAKMLASIVRIDRTGFIRLCSLVNQLFTGWERHYINTAQVDRDIHNLQEKYSPHLKFTAQEEERGKAELLAMGIPAGAKWVCLIARDAAYLPELSYHAYRDVDVDTYALACYDLAERGYYVLRMGAKVAKSFGATHPRIIDYAATKHRSDFMDVYLGAKCEFCISTGCGFDAIPVIFRRPVCFMNYVPLEYLNTWIPSSLAIWKHHYRGGKRMTPAEIYAAKAGHFMRADEFETAKITLVDNTPAEILSVALQMLEMTSETDDFLQKEFWDSFPRSKSDYNEALLHGEIRMRIGREFLKSYQCG